MKDSFLIRSKLPLVQRGSQVLEHRKKTAHSLNLSVIVRHVRYPTTNVIIPVTQEQCKTYGRKKSPFSDTVGLPLLEVCSAPFFTVRFFWWGVKGESRVCANQPTRLNLVNGKTNPSL